MVGMDCDNSDEWVRNGNSGDEWVRNGVQSVSFSLSFSLRSVLVHNEIRGSQIDLTSNAA